MPFGTGTKFRAGASYFIKLMTLTIAGNTEASEAVTLVLAGKMSANSLGELRRQIGEARNRRKQVVLDLGEVTLVDRHSAEFLAAQTADVVRLVNCPEYIERWIPRGQPLNVAD
jgi:ABC-type transporter Mla MlaB component